MLAVAGDGGLRPGVFGRDSGSTQGVPRLEYRQSLVPSMKCVYCRKPFGEIHWHDHPPAVVNEQGKTLAWTEIPLGSLQHTLSTHWPVCWNCHVAETFRRLHPELVTDRRAH